MSKMYRKTYRMTDDLRCQLQPNGASCLLTSVACIIKEDVLALMHELGHTGMDNIKCNGVIKKRGFNYEEIVRLLLRRQYLMTPIHSRIDIFDYENMLTEKPYTIQFTDLREIMKGREGVVSNIATHACAWFDNTVYDPAKGVEYSLDYFEEIYGKIFCFYNIQKFGIF